MASTNKPNIQVFKAGAAIAKGQPVKMGADDQHVLKGVLGTDKLIGIAQNAAPSAEDLVEVALPGGGAKGLCCTGGVTRGDLLTADSSANLVATTTPGDRVIGVAMASAVSADLFDVQVAPCLI